MRPGSRLDRPQTMSENDETIVEPENEHDKLKKALIRFKPFTKASEMALRHRIKERQRIEKKKKTEEEEGFLRDGKLVLEEEELKPDRAIADGKILTGNVAKHFPKILLGLPIEDIDPYYREYEEVNSQKCFY